MLSILLLSAFSFLSFQFALFSVRFLYIESLPLKQYNTISNRLEIHGVALTSHFTLIFFSSMPFTARLCVCVKWNNWNRTVIAVHIVIISMAIAIQMKNRTPSHKNGTANVQIHCRCCCGDLVKWESKWAACKNAMKMLIFKAIEMLRRLDYQSFVLLSMFSSPFYQFHLVSTVRIHSINLSVWNTRRTLTPRHTFGHSNQAKPYRE